jgi:hypothetical protein
MIIIYDKHQEVYHIQIEPSETVTIFNTSDIVEAREEFIKCMTRMFNDAICNKLQDGGKDEEAI